MIRYGLGAVFAIAMAAVPALAQNNKIAPQFGWINSYETGKALAKKTGKPIFLVFRCEP